MSARVDLGDRVAVIDPANVDFRELNPSLLYKIPASCERVFTDNYENHGVLWITLSEPGVEPNKMQPQPVASSSNEADSGDKQDNVATGQDESIPMEQDPVNGMSFLVLN